MTESKNERRNQLAIGAAKTLGFLEGRMYELHLQIISHQIGTLIHFNSCRRHETAEAMRVFLEASPTVVRLAYEKAREIEGEYPDLFKERKRLLREAEGLSQVFNEGYEKLRKWYKTQKRK